MSLIRQIWLLLLGTVLLAYVGSVVVNVGASRDTLQTQLRLKNSDNATALALVLSQQKGDVGTMALQMAAQFDTGFYERIRYTGGDGKLLFERSARAPALQAPGWFVQLFPVASEPGTAQVSDGWRALGSVEVVSQAAYAYDELWRASLRSASALAVLGLLAGLVGSLVVGRIRAALERTVAQAHALERGEYVTLDEAGAPELRRLTGAMNSMVARLKLIFEGQATQVEALRRQATCDPLTGLSNRAHFLGRLGAVLEREDGPADGGIVLLRVLGLAELNREIGHASADRAIGTLAQALQNYVQHAPGCFSGRLNGSDFALCLPAGGVAVETAQALTEALRAVLPAFGPHAAVAAGAVEIHRGMPVAQLMAEADQALARAENRGAFSVEAGGDGIAALAGMGEGAWRQRLFLAIAENRLMLGRFPVVGAAGELVHLECPLRLQIEPLGAYEVAARWLPLALRCRLTAGIDERAVALALQAIEADGQARCVNLSPASLADSGFGARLRDLLAERPRAAQSLWVELAETAALDSFDAVRELGRQLRPLGVRVGLEHAGERLAHIERLYEIGIDYVKLDAAVVFGVAASAARAGFVRGLAAMLHSLSLRVYAEGVADEADAQALWDCGVDGQTGPWVSAQGCDPAA